MEVEKRMAQWKWVTAAVAIVIVAGLAGWALSTPSTVSGQGTVSLISGQLLTADGQFLLGFTAGVPENSGIENVLICDNLAPNSTNFGRHISGENNDNWLLDGASDAIITANSDTATIPYEYPFTIVMACKVKADAGYTGNKQDAKLVAYVNMDNMYGYLSFSGAHSGTENTQNTGYEFVFDNNVPWTQNGAYASGYARVNCVFNNGGAGFKLPAGGTLSLDTIALYIWS
ncbi:MAG: hypothetical protein QXG10_04160 [Candidatus Hadarchaeales archaeon]